MGGHAPRPSHMTKFTDLYNLVYQHVKIYFVLSGKCKTKTYSPMMVPLNLKIWGSS